MPPQKRRKDIGNLPKKEILCMNCCKALSKDDRIFRLPVDDLDEAGPILNTISIREALTCIYRIPNPCWEAILDPISVCSECSLPLTQLYKFQQILNRMSRVDSVLRSILTGAEGAMGFAGSIATNRVQKLEQPTAATSSASEQDQFILGLDSNTDDGGEAESVNCTNSQSIAPGGQSLEHSVNNPVIPTVSVHGRIRMLFSAESRNTVIARVSNRNRSDSSVPSRHLVMKRNKGTGTDTVLKLPYLPADMTRDKLKDFRSSFTCPKCSLSFPTKASQQKHEAWVHEETEMKNSCKYCRKPCLSKRKLTEHYFTDHKFDHFNVVPDFS